MGSKRLLMAPREITTKQLKRKRDDGEDAGEPAAKSTPTYKQRVLVLGSRGITERHRHLMSDLFAMLPHAKKDSKHQLSLINELCDLNNCNNALFFEARRQFGDLFLWASKAPNGPSVRFHVLNAHTMDEMRMTGNCLKGSRPLLVFDQAFDRAPHLRLIKEILTHIFAVPRTARRAKPFIDHVLNLSVVDGKVWFRNYQILEGELTAEDISAGEGKGKPGKKGDKTFSLSEVGPRFVLTPVKIFEGSFNGACLYENEEFVPSSAVAAERREERAKKYRIRRGAQEERVTRLQELAEAQSDDELDVSALFA